MANNLEKVKSKSDDQEVQKLKPLCVACGKMKYWGHCGKQFKSS